ncbi:MAG: biosynthetic-type acetolactate synthase large subunit [Acutalibacteraceae bacterium]|nr:biosynthetic-type acetolactate synthase large subunit [Acutalibacteraceae bacterium]
MKLNGSEILVKVLLENEVDTVFGYPGGAVLNIYDALYKNQDKIKHYTTAHEQGASHAADGYARATGKTGVVLATSGPGATNLVTGIATAYMDSVPMVAITGNVGIPLIGRDSFQEVYITGITLPITKHNFVVRKIEDLADTLRQAFKIAISGRPGPVLVDIPKDITAAVTEYEPHPKQIPEKNPVFKLTDFDEIVDVINNAQKPVIFFGGGVKNSNAGKVIERIIKKADIPATHTMMASGVLRYDMPENLGLLGMHGSVAANKTVSQADVVIAVGSRFSDRVALAPSKFAPNAKLIQIDIDQSEIDKNVKTDYHIVGEAEEVLTKLEERINENKHDDWFKQINEFKKTIAYTEGDDKLHPKKVMDIISELAGEDGLYVTDVGQHQMWAAQYLHHVKAENFLTSGGLGTMGYGYGAAIGAQIGTGRKPVFHITGDGSFHMNMNEACTAASYNLPVISVCLNNSALGMVRQWQKMFYGKRYSQSEPNRKTNYVKVAEGFGLKGYSCKTEDEFRAAVEDAMKCGGPAWIECIIDREENVLPMIPNGGTVDDMICE